MQTNQSVYQTGLRRSPRIEAFRGEIINSIPRVPKARASLTAMNSMSTASLIVALVTWRMRFVPAKPRKVSVWADGVKPWEWLFLRRQLLPFLTKVEKGEDLTPHLSNLIHTKGIYVSNGRRLAGRKDIDRVLTRESLHHFHVGTVTPQNPTGRSDRLVFAEVLQKEFRIIAVSDHQAFKSNTTEHNRFSKVCTSYAAKDIPLGQGFMTNPVMSSGHSLLVTVFAMKCAREIEHLDPQLDNPAFIEQLYINHITADSGAQIIRPEHPSFSWRFEDLAFGFIETTTGVFFSLLPFFGR